MKVEKWTTNIQFLKRNPDYNYEWIKADDNCINNAVTVDGKYYIGRTIGGANTYLGRVNMGDNELKHENEHGLEVVTNQYQVLTCVEKACIEGTISEKKLVVCKNNMTTLVNEIANGKNELQQCQINSAKDKEMLQHIQMNNKLMKEMLDMKTDQLENCKNGSKLTASHEDSLTKTVCNLENVNENIEPRKIEDKSEEKISQLQAALAESQAERKNIQEQIDTLVKRMRDLDEVNKKYKGVSGCSLALKDVKTLTIDDHKTLMLEITRLLPKDLSKFLDQETP